MYVQLFMHCNSRKLKYYLTGENSQMHCYCDTCTANYPPVKKVISRLRTDLMEAKPRPL